MLFHFSFYISELYFKDNYYKKNKYIIFSYIKIALYIVDCLIFYTIFFIKLYPYNCKNDALKYVYYLQQKHLFDFLKNCFEKWRACTGLLSTVKSYIKREITALVYTGQRYMYQ